MKLRCVKCGEAVVADIITTEQAADVSYDGPGEYTVGKPISGEIEYHYRCCCGDINDIDADFKNGRLEIEEEYDGEIEEYRQGEAEGGE